MKTWSVCLTVAAYGLLLVSKVEAQHCGTPYRSTCVAPTIVKKEVVVKEVVPVFYEFAAIIPVVRYPTYGAQYVQPPVYTPPPSANPPVQPPAVQQDQMGQILAALKQNSEQMVLVMNMLKDTDQRLRKLEGKEAPKEKPKDPFNPQAQKTDDRAAKAARVVARACMGCHDQPVAQEKGGGFAMSDKDGYLAVLAEAQNAKVVKRIGNDSMPPKDSKIVLTQEDKDALNAHYGK